LGSDCYELSVSPSVHRYRVRTNLTSNNQGDIASGLRDLPPVLPATRSNTQSGHGGHPPAGSRPRSIPASSPDANDCQSEGRNAGHPAWGQSSRMTRLVSALDTTFQQWKAVSSRSTRRRSDIGLGLARISSTPGSSYGVTDPRSVGQSADCRAEGPIS
jgi:hypothetical protein